MHERHAQIVEEQVINKTREVRVNPTHGRSKLGSGSVNQTQRSENRQFAADGVSRTELNEF